MGNLYVAIDESNAGRYRARTTETLQKLRSNDGYFPQAADGADLLEVLLAEVFPDGMPGQFLASNLSLNDDYVLLALRPVLHPFRQWPFPAGRSLCIKGGYYLTAPQARFNILNVQEIADGPAREFEVPLDAVTYLSRPQNFRANHNALTPEFVATLPRVAEQTGERLTEWSQFLQWQEKVVLEKCQGLRFVDRRVTPQGVEFTVVARDAAALDKQLRALRRIDATAFGLGISTDEWEFRLQRQSRRGGDGPIDVQLGLLSAEQPHRPWQHPGDGPWNRPVQRSVRVAWNGRPFVEDHVLKGCSPSVADACEQRHLATWRATQARLLGLEAWPERARPRRWRLGRSRSGQNRRWWDTSMVTGAIAGLLHTVWRIPCERGRTPRGSAPSLYGGPGLGYDARPLGPVGPQESASARVQKPRTPFPALGESPRDLRRQDRGRNAPRRAAYF